MQPILNQVVREPEAVVSIHFTSCQDSCQDARIVDVKTSKKIFTRKNVTDKSVC